MQAERQRHLVGKPRLQLSNPAIDQPVPHVRASHIRRVRLGEANRCARDLALIRLRMFRNALHRVAITVARGKGHPRVLARRITLENLLHHTQPLDKVAPVALRDVPQTHDAVRHHQRRQGEPLRRARRGFRGADALLSEPAL